MATAAVSMNKPFARPQHLLLFLVSQQPEPHLQFAPHLQPDLSPELHLQSAPHWQVLLTQHEQPSSHLQPDLSPVAHLQSGPHLQQLDALPHLQLAPHLQPDLSPELHLQSGPHWHEGPQSQHFEASEFVAGVLAVAGVCLSCASASFKACTRCLMR